MNFAISNSNTGLNWADEADRTKILSAVPAIGATRGVNVTDSYQFFPTSKILDQLAGSGFRVVRAAQQVSRSRSPVGQEHVVRLRHEDFFGLSVRSAKADAIPEIVVMNSHNGRRALRAYAGIFRLVCENGMVITDQELGFSKIRHIGEANNFSTVTDVISQLDRKTAVLSRRISMMRNTILSPADQLTLVREIMAARGVPGWLDPATVMEVHRKADEQGRDRVRDMWTTFNVAQENLTRMEIQQVEDTGKGSKVRRMRPITSAVGEVVANGKMWDALSEFAARYIEDAEEVLPVGLRTIDEILASLKTTADAEAISEAELAALSKKDRARVSAKKARIKKKEAANV